MPELLWLYLTALLYYRTSANCVALAEALATVSHDRLTRLLQSEWSGQKLLEFACRTLFVCEGGYLIIDDTVIPKPFAVAIEGLGVFQPGAEAGVWPFCGPIGVDERDAAHSSGYAPVAEKWSLEIRACARVAQLCSQSVALPPGLRPV